MNVLSCGIRIWTQRSLVLSQITRLTDGQTDRQTAFSWLDRDACNDAAL